MHKLPYFFTRVCFQEILKNYQLHAAGINRFYHIPTDLLTEKFIRK